MYTKLSTARTCWTTRVNDLSPTILVDRLCRRSRSNERHTSPPIELYCELDTMLLCCAYMRFRAEVKAEFDLESAHYISLPQVGERGQRLGRGRVTTVRTLTSPCSPFAASIRLHVEIHWCTDRMFDGYRHDSFSRGNFGASCLPYSLATTLFYHPPKAGIKGGVSFVGRRYCEQSPRRNPDGPDATVNDPPSFPHSYDRCLMLYLGEARSAITFYSDDTLSSLPLPLLQISTTCMARASPRGSPSVATDGWKRSR